MRTSATKKPERWGILGKIDNVFPGKCGSFFLSFGLLRLFRRRDLNLDGVNVVGLCGVHGDYSKTSVRVARLNGSRGLRSGRAWAHRVGG
jgi:hypothetical protein